MGRQPPTGRPIGPPKKKVDWEVVDKMLKFQCSSTEIAGYFNIHRQTLYDKVSEEFDCTWTEYAASRQSCGLGLLRCTQFEKAFNTYSKANAQLLIWLGKQYLGQKDGVQTEIKQEEVDKMQAFFKMLSDSQASPKFPTFESSDCDLNNEDNNTSSE